MSNTNDTNDVPPSNRGTLRRVQVLSDEETVQINAILKQAVEACWNALPAERRDAENIRMEMMRLTARQVELFINRPRSTG